MTATPELGRVDDSWALEGLSDMEGVRLAWVLSWRARRDGMVYAEVVLCGDQETPADLLPPWLLALLVAGLAVKLCVVSSVLLETAPCGSLGHCLEAEGPAKMVSAFPPSSWERGVENNSALT